MSVKEPNIIEEQKIIAQALSVLEIESQAIASLTQRIDKAFVLACQTILHCVGRVVVTGMGKSGHVGRKIAATLASTGTPAFFLHPAEASHGDLGMITSKDVVLALSSSGETHELLTILPLIKRLGIPIIALSGAPNSSLARYATVHLDVSVSKEACPLGLAPTASTTAALAMGDAMALAVLEARGFTTEDFAFSHPGGRLGRKLLLKVEEVMHTKDAIPRVTETALLKEALMEISEKRLGFTAIVSADNPDTLIGIFTDGDLRRVLSRDIDIHATPIGKVMVKNCKTIPHTMLASEALLLMEKSEILMLPVLNEAKELVGAVTMHDLLKAGVL